MPPPVFVSRSTFGRSRFLSPRYRGLNPVRTLCDDAGMSYLGAGLVMFAVLTGNAAAPASPPAPVNGSASPVLTQQSSRTWATTIYLNSAAFCPAAPTFALTTTEPAEGVASKPTTYRIPGDTQTSTPLEVCAASKAGKGLVEVNLSFYSPLLATVPVTAAVVITPAPATAALGTATPVQVTVIVHRRVTSWEYIWIPLLSAGGIMLLFMGIMLLTGLRDPDTKSKRIRGARFWYGPVYAASGWTFGGSLATNITTAVAVVTAVLTATSTVGELLPGVELGRYSLLVAGAGLLTAIAPLVFGVLNYRFSRVDPTTAAVSVVTLPSRPLAALSRQARKILGVPVPPLRPAGQLVILDDTTRFRLADGEEKTLAEAGAAPANSPVTLLSDTRTLAGGRAVRHPRAAVLPTGGTAAAMTIAVPGGATLTLSGGISIAGTALKAGTTVAIPPGATVTLTSAPDASVALPGGTDIAIYDGQVLSISKPCYVSDDRVPPWPPLTGQITAQGGAKLSFLGRASLTLPPGTQVTAPGSNQDDPAKGTCLTAAATFPLPHTSQVIAAQMWSLLLASCLTLFGAGAELGILGVLAMGLASAALLIRALLLAAVVAAGLVVSFYSVTSIKALADTTPGDTLNTTRGTAFIL